MSVTPDEIEFATDLFSGLGPLTSRKMMRNNFTGSVNEEFQFFAKQ